MRKVLICLAVMLLAISGVAFAGGLVDSHDTYGGAGGNSTATGGTAIANGGIGIGGAGFGGSSTVKDSGNSSVGNGFGNFSPSAKVDNKNTNISSNSNKNTNMNSNKQAQGQIQGQAQGQVANGEVTVTGDSIKSYANSWPSISGAEGVSSGTASSIFGSLGMSNTEQYKKLMPQIQIISALVKDGVLSAEEGKTKIDVLVKRMLKSNKTQRFLGIFWETDSKSIMNLLGLLSWDSIWNEGQNPFQSKSDIK